MKNTSLYKGCLAPILLKLLQDNGRMYGYEITQKIKLLTAGELKITEGALYPLLHRLEAENILQVETENLGNRIRKYYSLTEKGLIEKNEFTVQWNKLKESVDNLVEGSE